MYVANQVSIGRSRTARRALDTACLVVALALAAVPVHVSAQWLGLRTPGIPRTPTGAPDMKAPAPRTSDGKPDLKSLFTGTTKVYDAAP
jgi:hypothetical protein